MNINTNYGSMPESYLRGIDESNKTGRTAKMGSSAVLTTGMEVQFLNEVNEVYTKLGLPTLERIVEMSTEKVDENIHSFNAKLNSLLGSFRGKPVMFDIYALMDIMQEMAQKMRDSLRELRNMENQTIQSNIRAQAAIQRSAAMQSMVAGAVLCGIQVVVAAVTTGVSIKNLSKQSAMMKSGGVDIMTKQNNLANTIGNEPATNKMVSSIETEYADAHIKSSDTGIIDRADPSVCKSQFKAVTDAKAKMDKFGEIARIEDKLSEGGLTAEQNIAVKEKTLSELKKPYEKVIKEAELNPNDQGLQQKAAAARKALNTPEIKRLTEEISQFKRLPELRQELGLGPNDTLDSPKGQEALKAAASEQQTAVSELEKAKGEYILNQNEKAVETAANEYKAVRAEANDEIAKNGKLSPEMQSKLRAAEGKFLLTRGKQIQVANNIIKSGHVDYNNTVNTITLGSSKMLSEAHEGSITKADQLNFGKLQARLAFAMSANQALGQLGQTLITGFKELISASATELQADQKMQEDQLDQIKDLFAQELSVIQKVFQLFEAVTQKESSTIENIIMA
ncbi:MAG: hypothetical protein MJ109_02185 [Kiritimatiellae bacterium]|nr:hypothetical protein [Kiritimatiellia bacterium]